MARGSLTEKDLEALKKNKEFLKNNPTCSFIEREIIVLELLKERESTKDIKIISQIDEILTRRKYLKKIA